MARRWMLRVATVIVTVACSYVITITAPARVETRVRSLQTTALLR